MSPTSRSLRRPWRPSLSPSATREHRGAYERGWGRRARVSPDADPALPCSVSEFLMGEVDSSTLLSVPPGDPSQVSRGGLDAARGQAGAVGGHACVRPGWGVVAVSCGAGIQQSPARGRLPRVSGAQTMENLYGPSGEGAAPSTDDCEAGEHPLSCRRAVLLGGAEGGGQGWGRWAGLSGWPAGCLAPEEVDMLLQRCEGGVDAALQYAKNMARYMKDLIGYLEKRTALGKGGQVGCGGGPPPRPCAHTASPAEMDFAKGLQKIVHNCRQSFLQEVGARAGGGRAEGRGLPPALGMLTAVEGAGEAGVGRPCAPPTPPAPVTAALPPTAPHAPPVHLLPGAGAGPGVWPLHGAGGEHAADPDPHAGARAGRQAVGGVQWGGAAPGPPPAHTLSPQPLNLRRLEHEKRRKEIKESWHRAQRKLVRPPVGAGRGVARGGWRCGLLRPHGAGRGATSGSRPATAGCAGRSPERVGLAGV